MAAPTVHDAPPEPTVQGWLTTVRRSWPIVRQVGSQMVLAGALALVVALILGYHWPFYAALFAIGTLEMICARHNRRALTFAYGILVGILISSAFDPNWPIGHALIEALIGAAAALLVAVATTPRNPVAEVRRSIDPLLTLVSTQVRAIATALRTGDAPGARVAVRALNGSDTELRRLEDTLLQVRRASILTRWRSGQDLNAATTTATEIAFAVRGIRAMALQAWWGVLRGGEPVPAALPQMLDALADGVSVLRGELEDEDQLRGARRLLISSAQWIGVMRTEPLGMAAAAAAANADAAVLNLLIVTGLSPEAAESSIRRPASV